MSQYVVYVESSSLNYHRSYSVFVCSLCCFIGGLVNLHADQMFRTIAEAKEDGLDSVN